MAETEGPSKKVALLLGRFPGPVTFHPSKLKWIVIAIILMVQLGFSMFLLWPDVSHLTGRAIFALGAFLAVPTLLLAFVAAITLGRDTPRMRLHADGFEVISLWGEYRMNWSEVGRFRSFLLLIFHVDTQPVGGRLDKFHRAYLCGNYRIWNDAFGLGPKNFAHLMNAWRERALSQPWAR